MVPCRSSTGGAADRQLGSFTPASPTVGSDPATLLEEGGSGLDAGSETEIDVRSVLDVGEGAAVTVGRRVEDAVGDGVDVLASVVTRDDSTVGIGALDPSVSSWNVPDEDGSDGDVSVSGIVVGTVIDARLPPDGPESAIVVVEIMVVASVGSLAWGWAVPPVPVQRATIKESTGTTSTAAATRRLRTAA